MPVCLAAELGTSLADSLATADDTFLYLCEVSKQYTGGSSVDRPAKTQASNLLASSLGGVSNS
jgi:hypothetical protein